MLVRVLNAIQMIRYFISLILLLAAVSAFTQRVTNKTFEAKIESLLSHSVPEITVGELLHSTKQYIFLDARESQEFVVSHIPGAINVGYNDFDNYDFSNLDKNKEYVVYCSIGYRSEKIAEKLKLKGFKKVFNLYGSIFEWANCGQVMHNQSQQETLNLHAYNKSWSKWIFNPNINKVW